MRNAYRKADKTRCHPIERRIEFKKVEKFIGLEVYAFIFSPRSPSIANIS